MMILALIGWCVLVIPYTRREREEQRIEVLLCLILTALVIGLK